VHHHQNHLQTVNQYSWTYNYYNYNYADIEFHRHISMAITNSHISIHRQVLQ
jgi:hypothetical protein